jgi:hypothetical protein
MTNKFNYSSASALAILSGVVLKNSSEQSEKVPSTLTQLGPLLFTLGWFGFAYSTSMSENMDIVFSDKRTMILFGASAAILISVFMMKNHMKQQTGVVDKVPMPMMYPLLFAGGWLVLGYNVSEDKKTGLVAALLALSSMMFVLPWQRKNNVIDGPGMSMFTLAWVILVYLNSHSVNKPSMLPTFLQNRF